MAQPLPTSEPSVGLVPARATDLSHAPSLAPREIGATLVALVQLTKPAITRMVLATTWCGAVIAPGSLRVERLVWTLVGTALVVGSANALNMFVEADVDALMARTRGRPIPSGRLHADVALWFGLVIGFVGIPILDLLVNPLTALVAGSSLLIYVLAYTPMKRVSPLAVWVGAVPGAVPPLLGWTSQTGAVGVGGMSLFLVLFVWQVPHFHAIAIFRKEEYQRAALQVLPVTRGVAYTKAVIAALLGVGLGVSALPALAGLGGTTYQIAAVVLGVPYFVLGLCGLSPSADTKWARRLFFASMPYLLGLYVALVVGSR
jgi:protoheme IX farnesyltransferase